VPACLLSQAQQSIELPQDSCASGELCAPCFNPIDGTKTGICGLHGDQPKEPPVRFDTACCGQSGLCIPEQLAGANAGMLPADSCSTSYGSGWLCAPKSVVQDPSTADDPFASCKVKVGFLSVGRGKCVPRCMVDSAGWVESLLSRSSCQSGELCVPCSVAKLPGC
jgi:hypothetical protein